MQKDWGLPTKDEMSDAVSTAEFAFKFFSRVLDDPIIDGHNRVLLAYLGVDAYSRATYPDAECELSSMWPDGDGKIRGHYPSELGKAEPLTNWRLPCIRDLHYGRRGGAARDASEEERERVNTFGDLAATSTDGVFQAYNFSAVLQWAAHDYPIMYVGSLKRANFSHARHAIEQAQALIAQQDPEDIRLGVYLYNPEFETVADLELQIKRTPGTSHRTVSASVYSYSFYGRPGSYSTWSLGVILCFLIHLVQYGLSTWRQAKFTASYRRVRSDYLWKRWMAIDDEDSAPHQAIRLAEAGSPCCNLKKGALHWGTVEIIALFLQYYNCSLIMTFAADETTVWEEHLPAADSAEDLRHNYHGWQQIFDTAKWGSFGANASSAIHQQLLVTGFSTLLVVMLLLRDLQWHDGIGVLASTLKFAAKDLQDVLLVTALLIGGFAGFASAVFGGFGSQDRFTSFRQSAESLALLGFGKTINYDTIVNDDLGRRFNGVGMGPMASIKPLVFWVMLFLFIFVIPNIILAIIVEGFERHVDVANQRVKVTLLQLLRRRVCVALWKLQDRLVPDPTQAPLAGRPKWARQMALASTPAALAALDGLKNPVSTDVLPIEVRDKYLLSRKEEEIWDELGDDEIKSQKAKLHEQRFFYRITTAGDLEALLRFGVDQGSSSCSEEDLSTLVQQVWQLHSKDVEGRGWAETVAEDHSEVHGNAGNHIRSVVRNELRPVGRQLSEIGEDNAFLWRFLSSLTISSTANYQDSHKGKTEKCICLSQRIGCKRTKRR